MDILYMLVDLAMTNTSIVRRPLTQFRGMIGRKWLGWQDSNLRMPASKAGALPLGDTPAAPACSGVDERPYTERKSEGNAPIRLFLPF
jgi:hypothetical protein